MTLRLWPTSDPSAVGNARERYVRVLGWLFAAFNFARVLTYLPSICLVHASGDSSQHSAVTWMTWSRHDSPRQPPQTFNAVLNEFLAMFRAALFDGPHMTGGLP